MPCWNYTRNRTPVSSNIYGMNFSDYLFLNEMLVHKVSQKPDHVVAFRGHLWLVNRDTPEGYIREIENAIRKEHPTPDEVKSRQMDSLDDLESWLKDCIPDGFVAHWDPTKRILWTSQEVGNSPVSAPLVKKVAETLKARKVSYNVAGYVGDQYYDYDRDYRRKQMLGRLPDEMFYGTTTKYLPSIMRLGLRPGQSDSNWSKQNVYHDDRVFLAARFEDSEFHASHVSHEKGGFPCVVQFAIPDRAQFQPDYDADAIATGEKHYGHPAEKLKNSPRASVDSVKMSRNAGLTAYTGRIPAAFIRAVFLWMGGKWKKVRLDTLRKRIEEDPWEWGYRYGLFD